MNRAARSLDPGGSVRDSRRVAGPKSDHQRHGGAPRIGIKFGLGEAFAGWRQIARILNRAGEAARAASIHPRGEVVPAGALIRLRIAATASPADASAEVAHGG